MKKLPRSFYARRTLTVAKDLLGKIFIRAYSGKRLTGKIVEVEAYLYTDPACHAFRGMTERNKVMFQQGGFLYVYFTYGMHFCANVVTYKEGIGEAVLIRAVEPLEGIDVMTKNRNSATGYNLTNGPAKFAQAFALTKEHSGIDLLSKEIYLIGSEPIPSSRIVSTTRIGISTAQEKKWRFYIKENPWVSRT